MMKRTSPESFTGTGTRLYFNRGNPLGPSAADLALADSSR